MSQIQFLKISKISKIFKFKLGHVQTERGVREGREGDDDSTLSTLIQFGFGAEQAGKRF